MTPGKQYAVVYYDRKRLFFANQTLRLRPFFLNERLNGFPPREPVSSYHPDAITRYIRVAEKRRRLWWNASNHAGTKWATLLRWSA